MKILLDECVTKRLRAHIAGHDVHTVSDMGWHGLKNGELLKQCVIADFDVIITIDKNMSSQQSISKHPIALIVFDSKTSKLEDLILFIPEFQKIIPEIQKGKVYVLANS